MPAEPAIPEVEVSPVSWFGVLGRIAGCSLLALALYALLAAKLLTPYINEGSDSGRVVAVYEGYHRIAAEADRQRELVLFWGSSLIREGVDCDLLEARDPGLAAYNLSVSGDLPYRRLVELPRALELKPDRVVIGVSYAEVFETRLPYEDQIGALSASAYAEMPEEARALFNDRFREIAGRSALARTWWKRKFLLSAVCWELGLPDRSNPIPAGFVTNLKAPHLYDKSVPEAELARYLAQRGGVYLPFTGGPELDPVKSTSARSLELLVRELTAQHAQVVLAIMPLHPLLNAKVPPERRAKLQQYLRGLASAQVEIDDFQDALASDCFIDLMHLNERGRIAFTSALAPHVASRSAAGPAPRKTAMTFNTLTYLYFFIGVMLGAWLIPGRRAQQFFLTAASLYFYGAWNHWLVLLIVASAIVDFLIALRMSDAATPTRRRLWLIVSLTSNLGMLSFFKYSNFLLDSLFTLQNWAGLGWMDSAPHWNIILPIGISFYTFQTLSYTVDVYRRKLEPVREFPRFLLFISFFPQLVAGPIVRATDFLPQLEKRAVLHPRNLQIGFTLFLVGLVKKVVFADGLGGYVENIYSQPEMFTSVPVMLATVAYAVQIYCDFSGYTDMAIGSAAALGFWLPKNFNHPYFSGSVTEFWSRWHISLSTWLRDYLYIPLGGNRQGASRTNINLLLVMLLGGLWHGAKWTFVLWGAYQGVMLVAHRCYLQIVTHTPGLGWYRRLRDTAAFRIFSVGLTLYLVLIGWIFFRAENFADLQLLLHKFVLFDGFHQVYGVALRQAVFVMLLIGIFFATHFVSFRLGGLADRMTHLSNAAWCALVVTGLFLVVTLTPAKSPEFIYFQF